MCFIIVLGVVGPKTVPATLGTTPTKTQILLAFLLCARLSVWDIGNRQQLVVGAKGNTANTHIYIIHIHSYRWCTSLQSFN